MKKNFLLSLIVLSTSVVALEDNPPTWPASVTICDHTDQATCQAALTSVYTTNGGPNDNGQFTGIPHAFLFKPGTFDQIEAKVGYYTSIIGLGESPTDTIIQHVHQSDVDQSASVSKVLSTFWRSAENFTQGQDSLTWAVSQAAPLRSVHAKSVNLSKNYAQSSGGFFANCTFGSNDDPSFIVNTESQQQWCARNSFIGNINTNGIFNLVFIGCTFGKAPSPGGRLSYKDHTPTIAEKPFITIDTSGFYYLQIPAVKFNFSGPNDNTDIKTVSFTEVYVATEADTAAIINMKIDAGIHVILTPGTYNLTEPIVVNKPDMVVLGIGFPILEANNADSCIEVGDVEGVRIAGVLLQATATTSKQLLKWGTDSQYVGNPSNPGILSDCFTRVGGPNNSVTNPVSSTTMIEINSGNVVCDNIWAWRADHDIQGPVSNERNPCDYGFVVNGENVMAYGLAVEHTLKDLTTWNGDSGQVYFYQSEFPYDVTQAYGDSNYVSYRVGSDVKNHIAYGIGAYTFFRDNPVTVANGIKIDAPLQGNNIIFYNSFTWFITGQGKINATINSVGNPLMASGFSYVYKFPSDISLSTSTMVNRFITQSETSNSLSWSTPSADPHPEKLTYKIFTTPDLNKQPIATFLPGQPRQYTVNYIPFGSKNSYWIVSENEDGITAFGNVTTK